VFDLYKQTNMSLLKSSWYRGIIWVNTWFIVCLHS